MPVRGAGLRVALQRRVVRAAKAAALEVPAEDVTDLNDPASDTEVGVDMAIRGLRRTGWVGLDGLAVQQLLKKGVELPEVGGTSFFPEGKETVMQIRQRRTGVYELKRTTVFEEFGEDVKAAMWLNETAPGILRALGLTW